MCEDVGFIETWLRNGTLAKELRERGFTGEIDGNKIVVAGGSAGAHVALLVPKLWSRPPTAILSLYGPTNLHSLPWMNLNFSSLVLRDPTPALLAAATNYEQPPSDLVLSSTDTTHPRRHMGQHIYRKELLAVFLLRGLVYEDSNEISGLRLPERERDNVTAAEIDSISPLAIVTQSQAEYPPVYQMLGTDDWLCQQSHMTEFAAALTEKGVKNAAVVVEGGIHGFDSRVEIGTVEERVLVEPAVEWIVGCL